MDRISNSNKFAEKIFKTAQRPQFWLSSAEHLRDGAEAILDAEIKFEIPYFRAHNAAIEKAVTIAYSDGNKTGVQEIEARVPNYPVAQLLYAYAIENLLKGIIVAKAPTLINGSRLDKQLTSHDLSKLSKVAGIDIYIQEEVVVQALSNLSIWAGRYPIPLNLDDYAKSSNRDELLDYGSQHPIMRAFFQRCHTELERLAPKSTGSPYGAVVVTRQPGT